MLTLAALIRKRESGKPATAIPATSATEGGNKPLSVARVATVAVANPRDDETDPLSPAAEARRQRVIAMLADNPGVRYAVLTDTDTDTDTEADAVVLALAIRGMASCELRIPRAKYDPLLLLHLIERHGATVH